MQEIKAGIVVVNRFCSPGSKMFFSYIDYMDREEAIRNESIKEYNLFNDYMGNPQKSSGLFTDGKRHLSKDEISELKDRFMIAQENQSLMWQTVISFDNRWLEEYGLYDSKSGILNEDKIKEMANVAINKMLRNEGLEAAVWTAAFHYNTDNIHIHVATVEEEPKRERKMYQQYSYVTNEKNRLVKDGKIVDLKGNPVFEEEIKGKFKPSSFEQCKQYIVREITKDKSLNQDINRLIRERMVRSAKSNEILRDPELAQMVLDLKQKLPEVSVNLLNYNNNIMAPFRAEIDRISEFYMEKYHGEEYSRLKDMIAKQSAIYRTAYGESLQDRDYQKTKTEDLYTRMGNSILQVMKSVDVEETPDDAGMDFFEPGTEDFRSGNNDAAFGGNESRQEQKEEDNYYLKWEKDYKRAKYEISEYSKGNKEISAEKAYRALHRLEGLEREGSVLAKYELGAIYKYGKMDLQDDGSAYEYYQDALKGYEYIYANLDDYLSTEQIDTESRKFYQDYVSYRIGQMYNKGLGTEVDYQKAKYYFEISNSTYAKYALGELYFEGVGVEQNYKSAAINYEKAIGGDERNPYALYRLGQMHYTGLYYCTNQTKAQEYFKEALSGFKKWDKGDDMFLKYRIGYMYYHGYGAEKNPEKALQYFEDSMKLGNENAKCMLGIVCLDKETPVYDLEKGILYLEEAAQEGDLRAKYELGKHYLNPEFSKYDEKKGIEYLEQAAEQGHGFAMYQLGRLHTDKEFQAYNFEEGLSYLTGAAEQNIAPAQYELGKIYTDPESSVHDVKKGMEYLEQAAEQGHDFAMCRLGAIYMNPESEFYDFEKGEKYYQEAMSMGNDFAACKMGDAYYYQRNDTKAAVEYYKYAADAGNGYAKNQLLNIITGMQGSHIRRNFEFEKAMRELKKSFEKDYKAWKNMLEHDEMLDRKLKEENQEL